MIIIDDHLTAKYKPIEAIYEVQKGDLLSVKVIGLDQNSLDIFNRNVVGNSTSQFNAPALYSSGYLVSSSGEIELPIVGKLNVINLSIDSVTSLVNNSLGDYYKHFTVEIKLINFKATVLGEIVKPQTFNIYENKINIYQLIAMAGGTTDYANFRKIKIVRNSDENVVVETVDLTSKDIYGSEFYYIKPNDVVYIEPLRGKFVKVNWLPISLIAGAFSYLFLVLRGNNVI